MGEYAQALQIFTFDRNGHFYKGKTDKEIELLERSFPLENETKIKKGNYSSKIEDFLLAKNINHWIATFGITPATKQIYENFIGRCKSQEYLTTVKSIYQKYDALTKGKPAPDIIGTTLEGKNIALSNFKGKVVYIDVWATWCGPCRKELPKTRMIEKKYQSNNQVVFMYVSVDEDITAWKALLKKDKNFTGVQVHDAPDNKHQSVWEKYLVWGIPRYILIDQNGKIVNSVAPRPSSGEVEKLIDSLLVIQKNI
jgi:thiol-disulfide isomerase/thioredoxin